MSKMTLGRRARPRQGWCVGRERKVSRGGRHKEARAQMLTSAPPLAVLAKLGFGGGTSGWRGRPSRHPEQAMYMSLV